MKIFIHWYEDFLVWTNVKFNNGNWTGVEYNLLWDHTCDCARVRFEIKSKISHQNCEVQLPLYYSDFEIVEFSQYQSDGTYLMASLLKYGNKKPFTSHLYSKQKWCNIEQKSELCDLEQTWFRAKNNGIRE